MKKTYICPESLTVKLNTKSHILQGSGFDNMGTDNVTGGLSNNEVSGSSNVWTKENKNLWDDEW